jgi:transposase InsO family protein
MSLREAAAILKLFREYPVSTGMKNKYDTAVVFLYSIGKEAMLPSEFRKQIPYSTISDWRRTDHTKYLGHEFRYFFDDALSSLELKYRYHKLKKLLTGLARSWITLSHLVVPFVKNSCDNKANRVYVLNAINLLRSSLGFERALKMTGISKTLYYQWTLESRFECFDSYTQLCVKRHPHQLGLSEIVKIKKLLTDPETDHWPIVSIASDAMRRKKVIASLFSWYRYSKFWGIKKKLIKKQKKKIGLIASRPNEYLHVDTTFYPLINDRMVCINFVMDNYSKMILGYKVAPHNSFSIVKASVSRALKVIAEHPDQKNGCTLVADGGKENHNRFIDEFLAKQSKRKIKKVKALKDIRFSNSPVEAIHRTIKGRYLRNRKFESIRALDKYLKWAVEDYNKVRPHYKHKPRTPYEAYFDIPLDFDLRKRTKNAVQKRIKAHKCTGCMQCTAFCGKKSAKTDV